MFTLLYKELLTALYYATIIFMTTSYIVTYVSITAPCCLIHPLQTELCKRWTAGTECCIVHDFMECQLLVTNIECSKIMIRTICQPLSLKFTCNYCSLSKRLQVELPPDAVSRVGVRAYSLLPFVFTW